MEEVCCDECRPLQQAIGLEEKNTTAHCMLAYYYITLLQKRANKQMVFIPGILFVL